MTRIELLPENDVVTTLKKALADIEELKQVQRLGRDSLRPQIISSANTIDFIAEQDPYNPPYPFHCWFLLTFTADNQLNPYTRVFAEVFDMSDNPLAYSSLTLYDVFEGNYNADDGVTRQQLIVDSATPFKLKFYIQASDRGSYDIELQWGTPA